MQRLRQVFFQSTIHPGNRHQLGSHLLHENPRIDIAARTGQCPATHAGIHMDIAIGNQLGARADSSQHHQIAIPGIHLLAGAHRTIHHQGFARTA